MQEGRLPDFSFPGSYPIVYIANGHVYCGDCASDIASEVDAHHLHMEGAPELCYECSSIIESAYGVPVPEDDEDKYIPRDQFGEPMED